MRYLALDIGSSFMKCVLFELERLEISSVMKLNTPDPDRNALPGRFEVDAERLYRAAADLIETQFRKFPDIAGIVLATQMHGFVLANAEGRPVSPYISWQDERCLEPSGEADGTTYLDGLRARLSEELVSRAGVPLKPGLALCSLHHWLHEHRPAASREPMRLCTLGSYVTARLTGAHACHMTNAAATGFADIASRQWNRELIVEAGCGDLIFPDLCDEAQPVGYYSGPCGPVPVFPDIGDHQASVLGSFATPRSDVVITIGTAGLLSRIDERADRCGGEVRPFFEGSFLHTVTRIPGGRNLDVLVRFVRDVGEKVFGCELEEQAVWERIIALAADARDSRLQVRMGYFPLQQGVDRGSIEQIDADNLRVGQLFQAAFVHLADVYDMQIDKLCPDRSELRRLVFSGGVAWKIGLLTETMTARIGLPSVMAPLLDESLAGLFRLALVSSGLCRSLEETRALLMDDEAANRSKLQIKA